MAKFNRKGKNTPEISTASLPDIVFMLLFFFMVTTVMRPDVLKLKKPDLPEANQIKKLEKKSLISYIYVGQANATDIYGDEPVIQLNDAIKEVENVKEYIENERTKIIESDRPKMTVSMKADSETNMGIITDIKQELRKAQALKINYSTKRKNNRN